MTNMMIEDLELLKTEIEKAEIERAKEEGTLTALKDRLKEYGLSSVKKAEKELGRLKKEVKDLKEEIDDDYTTLKEEYSW